MSKEDMHETIVEHQRQLHERAIRGDFTPDKLQKLRATYYQAKQAQEQEEQEEDAAARRTLSNQQPSNDPYGWSKIHPGMDDDDDDDDENVLLCQDTKVLARIPTTTTTATMELTIGLSVSGKLKLSVNGSSNIIEI
mmetsp:Transcript_4082/g.6138  ORF Transcript_4082/g.6138 Transcript_4082/m.6138 type:complete len:137 (-) Transcript_4082:71-481(-)